MQITRRKFLQATSAAAAAIGLSQFEISKMIEAVADPSHDLSPTVFWLQGATCSGCITSMLNLNIGSADIDSDGFNLGHTLNGVIGTSGKVTIDDVLIDIIDLRVQQTAMSAAGELAVSAMEGPPGGRPYALVVEGSVQTNHDRYCTIGEDYSGHFGPTGSDIVFKKALEHLGGVGTGSHAPAAILAVGTCAAYGGIPAALSNPAYLKTGAKGVYDYFRSLGTDEGNAAAGKVINLPGCPLQPDRVFLTVASIIAYLAGAGDILQVLQGSGGQDSDLRPKVFYGKPIHVQCERQPNWNASQFATKPGEAGCMMLLGCKGYSTYADCATRGWNRRSISTLSSREGSVTSTSWPVRSNHPCMGCSEKTYPDHKYDQGFVKYDW